MKEREKLTNKVSDIFERLLILSVKCNIDLPTAARNKIKKNAKKYPTKLVHGSSKKYTEYKEVDGRLVVEE